jgi:hypothetical protein
MPPFLDKGGSRAMSTEAPERRVLERVRSSLGRCAHIATMPTPPVPSPRGPLSEYVVRRIREPTALVAAPALGGEDPLGDDDFALALYVAYELHYRSFGRAAEDLEWDPEVLRFRRGLEQAFVTRLVEECGAPHEAPLAIADELDVMLRGDDGPSLSAYMEAKGSFTEMREFAVHRSAYQLKEADPHTWAIPRLDGAAKAALVKIQSDEYGFGNERAMHQQLFVETMQALGLDAAYGAYVNRLPATTLATVNLISLFGLHRRWRGALVGNLAVYEMTSVVPMGRYSRALQRLGVAEHARAFYDVHVIADAEHQVVARRDLAGGLARREPDLVRDIAFGARATLEIEARFARSLLDAWSHGRSSLVPDLVSAA